MTQALASKRRRVSIGGWLLSVLTWLILLVLLIPTLWIPLTSLRPEVEIASSPPVWLPKRLELGNYQQIFDPQGSGGTQTIFRYTANSLTIALVSIVIAVLVGALAGYVLSRFTFRGRDTIFFGILVVRTIPPLVLGIPLFVMYRTLDLYDTRLGLILIYTATSIPFATWLMESFFAEVPREVQEAAAIDGCSKLQVFRYVALPLARNGLATTAIFVFITVWSEFGLALNLTGSPAARTLPVALYQFIGEFRVAWGPLTAVGTILLIPALIFTAVVQRHLARGLTFGAVKG
jgi:multiple sugar transport system permease protein